MIRINRHIVKFLAVSISLIYVLMPLHNELKGMLHSVSHYLEMPNSVLSHNQDDNLNYKYKKTATSFHQHKIIDFLDLIDSSTTTENSDVPNLVDNKIDKHFFSSTYRVLKQVLATSPPVLCDYTKKIKNGFHRKIIYPPETI